MPTVSTVAVCAPKNRPQLCKVATLAALTTLIAAIGLAISLKLTPSKFFYSTLIPASLIHVASLISAAGLIFFYLRHPHRPDKNKEENVPCRNSVIDAPNDHSINQIKNESLFLPQGIIEYIISYLPFGEHFPWLFVSHYFGSTIYKIWQQKLKFLYNFDDLTLEDWKLQLRHMSQFSYLMDWKKFEATTLNLPNDNDQHVSVSIATYWKDLVIVGLSNGKIKGWEMNTREPISFKFAFFGKHHEKPVTAFATFQDCIISQSDHDSKLIFWKRSDQAAKVQLCFLRTLDFGSGNPSSICRCANQLAVGTWDQRLLVGRPEALKRCTNISYGESIHELDVPSDVIAIAYSKKHNQMITAHLNGNVGLWNFNDFSQEFAIKSTPKPKWIEGQTNAFGDAGIPIKLFVDDHVLVISTIEQFIFETGGLMSNELFTCRKISNGDLIADSFIIEDSIDEVNIHYIKGTFVKTKNRMLSNHAINVGREYFNLYDNTWKPAKALENFDIIFADQRFMIALTDDKDNNFLNGKVVLLKFPQSD